MLRPYLLVSCALGALAAPFAGCGGLTGDPDPVVLPDDDAGTDDEDAASGGHGGSPIRHDAGTAGTKDAGTMPKDAFSEFVDPGCPDAAKMTDFECDPSASGMGGCPPGEACFPFVEYPMMECGTETYGARCSSYGDGHQGDPCTNGCAPKYICVVSGQGTQCVALCDLTAPLACKNGLLCAPIDIPGIGGCL